MSFISYTMDFNGYNKTQLNENFLEICIAQLEFDTGLFC